MYARVASFEGREAKLTDELVARARQHGPATVPDAKGFLGLFDRERGTALSITFFDTEDAVRNSEQAFEDMAQNFPPEMRGRRTSVDALEVVVFEGDADRAKAARVSMLDGSTDSIDEDIERMTADTLPQLREVPGNVGAIGLADRTSGRVTLVTLWESTEALRQSEEQANRLRDDAAQSANRQIAGVERYDVELAKQPSGIRA